jgi:hypothetical protein
VTLSSSLWKGTTMETVGFAVRSGMVHLSAKGAIHRLEPLPVILGWKYFRIIFERVSPRGKAIDSERFLGVRLGRHGCSSSSQKMQYAVQTKRSLSDLSQRIEKTRDGMSSSGTQCGEQDVN